MHRSLWKITQETVTSFDLWRVGSDMGQEEDLLFSEWPFALKRSTKYVQMLIL